MDKLNVELCPETGICSIIKKDGTKVDLMPGEVKSLRAAGANAETAREIIADSDAEFAKALAPEELAQLAARLQEPPPKHR
jgi:hypothetical protein